MALVLTVIRGWIQAGQPQPNAIGGSYPTWQRGMTGLLQFAGLEGELMHENTNMAPVAADDQEWALFYQAIDTKLGDKPWTAAQLVHAASNDKQLQEFLPGRGHQKGRRAGCRHLGV